MFALAQSVSGHKVFCADNCANRTGIRFLYILALVGLYDQEAGNALGLAAARIVNLHALLDAAAVYADEYEFSDKRVCPQFKCQSSRRGKVVGNDFQRRDIFIALGISLNRRNVQWRRQVVHNGIQQHLHSLVLKRRTGNYTNKFAGQSRLADAQAQLVFSKVSVALEEALHNIVVKVCNSFNELGSVLFGLFLVFGGNFDGIVLHPRRIGFVVNVGLHCDEANQPL